MHAFALAAAALLALRLPDDDFDPRRIDKLLAEVEPEAVATGPSREAWERLRPLLVPCTDPNAAGDRASPTCTAHPRARWGRGG